MSLLSVYDGFAGEWRVLFPVAAIEGKAVGVGGAEEGAYGHVEQDVALDLSVDVGRVGVVVFGQIAVMHPY